MLVHKNYTKVKQTGLKRYIFLQQFQLQRKIREFFPQFQQRFFLESAWFTNFKRCHRDIVGEECTGRPPLARCLVSENETTIKDNKEKAPACLTQLKNKQRTERFIDVPLITKRLQFLSCENTKTQALDGCPYKVPKIARSSLPAVGEIFSFRNYDKFCPLHSAYA